MFYYGLAFFKCYSYCEIIFDTGKLIKEANSTNLTLVPKKATPSAMGDYRPILLVAM